MLCKLDDGVDQVDLVRFVLVLEQKLDNFEDG